MAVFRAVENGRPMIRAANTGFSAFIGPHGHIMARSHLFKEEVLTRELRLGPSSMSVYTRYGDLFAFVLSVISLLRILHMIYYEKWLLRRSKIS
jgi:apolipoprotein N-acyltransferase